MTVRRPRTQEESLGSLESLSFWGVSLGSLDLRHRRDRRGEASGRYLHIEAHWDGRDEIDAELGCDLDSSPSQFDLSLLGQFHIILTIPPWDIRLSLHTISLPTMKCVYPFFQPSNPLAG
ncbi:hypothetical protein C8R42DRAFT_648957 [Lentinula raphanica]|nr:hypothetical protein C8R42DRAFT_648957 [Lentinula raphanica]